MPHSKRKKSPKRILVLPDLEQAKTAVLNSLSSASGQRTYEHAIREFVGWYCSEPRLAFNRTVVLRYRIHLEQRHLAPATINLRLAAVRRIAYEAADAGLLSPELAAGIRPRKRASPYRRAPRELVNAGTGPTVARLRRTRNATRTTRPCHARDADRMRVAARRTSRTEARINSAAGRSLGDRRLGRQGPACPDCANSNMGEGRDRRMDNSCGHHAGMSFARSTKSAACGAIA